MKSFRHGVIALALAGVFSPAASWAQDATSQQEMLDELKSLRAEVQQLKQQQQADRETFSTAQVDATVKNVIADADRRSQLMADVSAAPTAGYNNGFFVQSDDKNFSLKTNLIFQVRNNTTWREDGKNNATEDDIQHGWEIRRAKLVLSGNIFGKDITYRLQVSNESNGAGFALEDAWIGYTINKNWGVRVGQQKLPFNHEELTSDTQQLAVERSLLNQLLGGGAIGPRVQGILVQYKNDSDNFRADALFGDGDGSVNTDYRDNVSAAATATSFPIADTRSRFGGGGRVEYLAFGKWDSYRDFSARLNKDDLLVLGAGVDVSQAPQSTNYRGTVDAQWENTKGLGIYGAVLTNYADQLATGPNNRFDWGLLGQIGYAFDPKWEVFGRYDVTFFDKDAVTGDSTFPEISVGVTRFLGNNGNAGHRAQIVFDINYLPSSVPSNAGGLGYLANGGRNEIVARLQFQLEI